MSSLAEIERAVETLSPQEQQELMLFLGARRRVERSHDWRKLSPAERAADLQYWAAGHERGPRLSDAVIGRDSIYK